MPRRRRFKAFFIENIWLRRFVIILIMVNVMCMSLVIVLVLNPSYQFTLGWISGIVDYINPYEKCNDRWITSDIRGLKSDLEANVFGQPLLVDVILPALSAHLMPNHQPKKALVLSFHGWPGGGKNFVANFIMKWLLKKGPTSRFAHLYTGRMDFPLQSKISEYQARLRDSISSSVKECPRSIFIFDEVDFMPQGILETLKPYIDYHENIRGIDYRKSTFIFLSNIGGNLITERTLELWRSGRNREDYKLRDFEDILRKGSFNEMGGLRKSVIIESHLIDHYVPFLPLEREHVIKCIKTELRKMGHWMNMDEIVNDLLDDVNFGPEPENLFSSSGCKTLSQKLSVALWNRDPRLASNNEL